MNATRAVAHIDTSDEFWRPILGGDMNNCPTNRSLPTSFLQNLTHTTLFAALICRDTQLTKWLNEAVSYNSYPEYSTIFDRNETWVEKESLYSGNKKN